ncbi:hypothetical protein H4219_001239 [Mycoemilia scoparia]|uniref:Uncharacterized protein n=1 Tax=Mycoemilia scoparia TaxID=417184 RepID=A0A9W8A748_9FUNG|nr:hypothetical protein H4219_001239 [Mycoemilia scoparia]
MKASWFGLFFGNSLYFAAMAGYSYITYLGYQVNAGLAVPQAFQELKEHGCKAMNDFSIKSHTDLQTLLSRCPQLLSTSGSKKGEGHPGAHDHHHKALPTSSLEGMIGFMFPQNNPALASILATFYISLFPNLILFAIPSSIPQPTLKVLVSFAIGGLLGDVFLHLLPHIFMEAPTPGVDISVRNVVYGCTIFAGLLTFFIVDRIMRIFGAGHSHSHGGHDSGTHSHAPTRIRRGSSRSCKDSNSPSTPVFQGLGGGANNSDKVNDGSAAESEESPHHNGLRRRINPVLNSSNSSRPAAFSDSEVEADDEKGGSSSDSEPLNPPAYGCKEAGRPIKLSAYLNLIADAAHNFTDGLAISASFYLSPAAGLSTFVAIFFHEIPHELGDFAILIQSGFSFSRALASQFFTAIGAMAGTIVGVMVEESGRGRVFQPQNLFSLSKPWFVDAALSNSSSQSSFGLSWIFSTIFPLGSLFGLFPSNVAGVGWNQLIIPFTAGGFVYIGTASVIPELLEPSQPNVSAHFKSQKRRAVVAEIWQVALEIMSMLLGVGLMALIAMEE